MVRLSNLPSWNQEWKLREFWNEKYGEITIQTNVEDQRLGVDVYMQFLNLK